MNTIVSDMELKPRLKTMIADITQILIEQIAYIKEPTYFDFVQQFVKFYATDLTADGSILHLT